MALRSASLLALPLAVLLAAACSDAPANPPAAGASGSGADGGGGGGGNGDADGGGGGSDGGVPLADAASAPVVTVTQETLASGGQTRKYVLVVPKTYDAGKTYPLVLVLHGDGGEGVGYHAFHPFEAASGQEAILAYPSGTNFGWDLYTATAQNKEMQFVQALVADLAGKYSIDTSRVFGDGYSSGAYFISQMSCRVNGFFKGITMHAGGAPDEMGNPPRDGNTGCIACGSNGGGPTAALILQGTNDGTVLKDYGEYAATCWATTNGCPTDFANSPNGCRAANACPSSKPVELCIVPGLGHTVWSEGAARSWNFFKGLP